MRIQEIQNVKTNTLLELFDKTVPWKSGKNTETGSYVFKFSVDNIPITAKAENTGNGEYDFMFTNDNHISIDTTEEGHQFVILGTVAKILKTFIDAVMPNKVYFTASTFNKGQEHKSRAKVYAMMAKRNTHKDYDVDIDTSNPNIVLFTYTRKIQNKKNNTGIVTGDIRKIISTWQKADQADYEKHKSLIDTDNKVLAFVEKVVELINANQKDKMPFVTFSKISKTPVDTKSKLIIIAFLIANENKIQTKIVGAESSVGESIEANESFNTKPGSIVDKSNKLVNGSLFYNFVVNGKQYVVEFAKVKHGVFDVDFSTGGNFGLTNERQQMKVLSTVIEVILRFIKKHKPISLLFSAGKESNYENENIRAKVYTRMLNKFLPDEYTYSTSETRNFVNFKVSRVNVNESFDTEPQYLSKLVSDRTGNRFLYKFTINDEQYVVEFQKVDTNSFEVDFSADGNYQLTNSRQHFKVLSTVMEAMSRFAKTHNPDVLLFSAAKDLATDKKISRGQIYTRMLNKFLPDGYTYTVSETQMFFNFKISASQPTSLRGAE